MLGDVLLLEPKHEEAALAILPEVLKHRGERYIIAISGESGSGKTELAHSLAKLLKNEGIRAKPIHSDNYYRIHPVRRTAWRKEHSREFLGLTEYDWTKIHSNLEDFLHGQRSDMPCVDITTDQVDRLHTDFSEIDMVILDGLYAIASTYPNLKVFIDLTYQETTKAQLRRGKEPMNEFRAMVLEREHEVVQSLRPMANLLVDKEYLVIDNPYRISE